MSELSESIRTRAEERPIDELALLDAMEAAAAAADTDSLQELLRVARWDDPWDDQVAEPAVALLPRWGAPGLALLASLIQHGKFGRAGQVLRTLHAIAKGRCPVAVERRTQLQPYEVGEQAAKEATVLLRRLLLEQHTNSTLRDRLLFALYSNSITTDAEVIGDVLRLMTDVRLVLNERLLSDFRQLLDVAPEREQKLHDFLIENPVFLDPMAVEVLNKHALGSDLVTDFVLRRFNDEYVLVEIEKSIDSVFTRSRQFSSEVTHAVGQVEDFQVWVADNIAYARNKLPGISRPEGLVVIGRRQGLDTGLLRKLEEANFSRRGHTRIMTFDDLLSRAEAVYRNMLNAPLGATIR